jgi:hypothetical protein
MHFPDFFSQAPVLAVRDPLADFLGAADDGLITYTYADAVKLSGHSCPTVAGAYLMVCSGLRHLYGDGTPERGSIEVFMHGERDEGTTGVMANVAMLLTGAAPETGFGGIGGRFARRGLLHFAAPIAGIMALRRTDTRTGVELDLDAGRVPPAAEMSRLFSRAATGHASRDELQRFGMLWQQRVGQMLLEHADDPALVRARSWKLATT